MKYVGWLVVLTGVLLCSNVWAAAFNPDTDPNFLFNLNFEDNTDAFTTIDAKASKTGTIVDYNTLYDPTMWTTGGIRNICGDFKKTDDVDCNYRGGDGNDQSVHVVAGPDTSLFEWGIDPNKDKRTWAFWFNMPDTNGLSAASIVRYENFYKDEDPTNYGDYWWEIGLYNGRLQVAHKKSLLTMAAVDNMTTLGIAVGTWHHAVVVIDRTARTASKLYIDGLPLAVNITKYAAKGSGNVDFSVESPLWIGAGDRNFDGKLDEIRSYDKALSPTEVSILYQYNAYDPNRAVAIYPIPKSTGARITTDVNWIPAPNAGLTKQKIYFSTATGSGMPVIKEVDASEVNSIAYNSELNGGVPLKLNQAYNWYIRSTIGGVYQRTPANASSYFTFTTENGDATDPVPAEFQEDIAIGQVDLQWTAPSADSYDVYFSTNTALVEINDPNVRIANDITDNNIAVAVTGFGETYSWRVVSYYGNPNYKEQTRSGSWSFVSERYPVVFNTDDINDINYGGHLVNGLDCDVNDSNGWRTIATATIASDGVAVFNFPDGFRLGKRYGVVVFPLTGSDLSGGDVREKVGKAYPDDFNMTPTPIDINVTGDFYFDGTLDISGNDIPVASSNAALARCGGYRGAGGDRRGDTHTSGVTNDRDGRFRLKYDHYNRLDHTAAGTFVYYDPNELSDVYTVYGPGQGRTSPYKAGGGGGYGAKGGDSGRAYYQGTPDAGQPYGDKEVPVPFGGSSGGNGSSTGGGPGGGGFGILATGNVTIDEHARIFANGGSVYGIDNMAGGGGAGGSVRIIADGNVTIAGSITVNGGVGGSANSKANNSGGGGAGGRVAIFYGNSYTRTGTITATAGAEGICNGSALTSNGYTLAEPGNDGTIYVVDSTVVSPKKASAPTPRDGNELVYAPSASTSRTLSWYSGYKAADDRVWFGTNPLALVAVGDAGIPATRGQHSVTVSIDPDKTYYWKVMTDNNSISSDVWSFKTVGWRCMGPDYNTSITPQRTQEGWPEWDINGDCVLNDADIWYFAKDWRVYRGGGDATKPNEYVMTFGGTDYQFYYNNLIATWWLECRGRTDSGCSGW